MTNQLTAQPQRVQSPNAWAPPAIRNIEDTGLNMATISDLALKVMYFGGFMTGSKVADIIKLPFVGVGGTVEPVLYSQLPIFVGAGRAPFSRCVTRCVHVHAPRRQVR